MLEYRHTFVSLNEMAGTPQAHIQKLAGHTNPAMTDLYTDISDVAAIQYARHYQTHLKPNK